MLTPDLIVHAHDLVVLRKRLKVSDLRINDRFPLHLVRVLDPLLQLRRRHRLGGGSAPNGVASHGLLHKHLAFVCQENGRIGIEEVQTVGLLIRDKNRIALDRLENVHNLIAPRFND